MTELVPPILHQPVRDRVVDFGAAFSGQVVARPAKKENINKPVSWRPRQQGLARRRLRRMRLSQR